MSQESGGTEEADQLLGAGEHQGIHQFLTLDGVEVNIGTQVQFPRLTVQ